MYGGHNDSSEDAIGSTNSILLECLDVVITSLLTNASDCSCLLFEDMMVVVCQCTVQRGQ